ncbi:MAG: MFS transporter [Thermomicrobiales bacterium]
MSAGAAPATTGHSSIGAVLRNGPFLRLWLVQLTTQVCQNMINFALLLRVRDIVEIHQLPQANTAISLVILAFSLPAVLFGPVAGVVADRVNKRYLMSVLNLSRAIAVMLFLLIRPTWHVETILIANYLVVFLFGMAGQFFAPVEGATIPLVVKRHQLLAANSLFSITITSAQLIGFAAVGPIFVKVLGIDRLFVVSIVLYLVCAGIVLTLPKTPVQALREDLRSLGLMSRLWTDLKEGLIFILQDPTLMRAIGYLTLASTTFLLLASLGPEFVTAVIGLTKEDIGYLVAPAGLGVLSGVFLVSRMVRRFGREWLVDLALVAAGLFLFLLAITRGALTAMIPGTPSVVLVASVCAVFAYALGLCNAFVLVPSQTMLQERSHEEVRARVYATFFTISNTVAFIPIFFAAASADLFGVVHVLIVVAIIVGGLGASMLFHRSNAEHAKWRRVRTLHRQGPDSLPGRNGRNHSHNHTS